MCPRIPCFCKFSAHGSTSVNSKITKAIIANASIDIIEIMLLDEHHQSVNTDTKLSVDGNILALASYNQKHPFTLNEITVHQGRALLIVPAKESVKIKVDNQIVMING